MGSGKRKGLGSCLQENIMKNWIFALNPTIYKLEDDWLSAVRRRLHPVRTPNYPLLDKGGGASPVVT